MKDTSPANSETAISNQHEFQKVAMEVCNSKQVSAQATIQEDSCSNVVKEVSNKNTYSNTSVKEISNSSTIVRRTTKPSTAVNLSTDLEVSKFDAAKVIHDHEVKFITSLWELLQSKIARAPYNEIPSLRNEVDKIFDAIKITKTIDISPLKSMVDGYFTYVERFNELQSSSMLSQDKLRRCKNSRSISTNQ